MTVIISGVLVAVGIMITSWILAGYFTYRLIAATILVAIAFIYLGFSLMGGTVREIIMETVVVFFFISWQSLGIQDITYY